MLELGLAGFETGDARLIGLGAGPRGPSSVRLATAGCMCVCERERELEGGASYALEYFASFDCYAGTSVALAGAKGRGAS